MNGAEKKGEQYVHNAKPNESHGIRIMHFCVACNDVFKWNVFAALKKQSSSLVKSFAEAAENRNKSK